LQKVLDELKRSLKYHQRQLDDNLSQIKAKGESISILKEANKKHEEIIQEFEKFIKEHEEVN
jgi:flagellar motility protein MotE (MotC chaperone)